MVPRLTSRPGARSLGLHLSGRTIPRFAAGPGAKSLGLTTEAATEGECPTRPAVLTHVARPPPTGGVTCY
jgi:hypothetical protein